MYGHSLNHYKNGLYLFGGTTGFEFFRDLYRYDLLINTWQKVQIQFPNQDLQPEPRYKHCTVLVEDKLIVFGGLQNNTRLGVVREFDITNKKWSILF